MNKLTKLTMFLKLRPLLSLVVLVGLASCQNNQPKPDSLTAKISPVVHIEDAKKFDPSWSRENTLVYHIISEPDNLHPTNGNSQTRLEVLNLTQQNLLRNDFENQTLLPVLVKSLPVVSADGLSYTYELRQEPRWDNGDPLSVSDVVFTAKASKCALTNNLTMKPYWQNLRTIVLDPSTPTRFTLVMKHRNIQNITFLTSFAILQRSFHDPSNVLENYSFEQLDDTSFQAIEHKDLVDWSVNYNDDKYGRDPSLLNGLGPYKVEKWEPGQYLSLVKKKDYWGSKLAMDFTMAGPEKIIFKLNKDDNAVQLDFKSQVMDVSTNLSVNSLLALQEYEIFQTNYNAALTPTYNFTYVAFNEKPDGAKHARYFEDAKTRRALAYLTPVDELIKLVYKAYSPNCRRMITNVSPLKTEYNSSLEAIPFDPEKGRELLADAGWSDSDGDGVVDKIIDGKKVQCTPELLYLNSSADWKDMASLIAEQYAKAGVKVTPVIVEQKIFLDKARAHDFDMLLGSWGASSLPEDYTQIWHSTSWKNHGSNYTGFGNAESDALIDSIKGELEPEKRVQLVKTLQKEIYDDQPCVFLYCSLRRNIVHKRFGNLKLLAERPGVLLNTLRLLSTNTGISLNDNPSPH